MKEREEKQLTTWTDLDNKRKKRNNKKEEKRKEDKIDRGGAAKS